MRGRRVGRGRRRRAHDLRQRRRQDRRGVLEGPLPRTAPAEHPHDRQRLDDPPQRRRVLARLGEEPAAAAHLRHRLADQGRAARVPGSARRRPPSATTASSGRSSTCSRSPTRSGPGSSVWHPKGGVVRQEMEQHALKRNRAAGYSLRLHPAHHEEGPVRAVRAPRELRGGHVPAHAPRRGARREGEITKQGRLLPEADELPDAHPDLQGARAQLPRPADAAGRVRHRLPQRAVRRAARPHPRARLHQGRRAPVRHARPARGGGRQDRSNFVLSMLRDFGLDDFYLELSTRDDAGASGIGDERDLGARPPSALRRSREASRPGARSTTRAAPRSTARRSPCRRATRSAAPGSCRPCSSTSTCPSGSSSSTPPPTAASSGR